MELTEFDKREIEKFILKHFKKVVLKRCEEELDRLSTGENLEKELENSGIRQHVESALKAVYEARLGSAHE